MRLDVALVARHPELSRRRAQAAIEGGQVTVDGVLVQEPGTIVAPGARLEWNPNRPLRRRVRSTIPILHEDDHVVVVDKPAGLLSVPTHAGAEREDTALGRVQAWARVRAPRHPFVGPVHRLDRDTSGALAFALSPTARKALIALVSQHRFDRRYAALVRGEPRDDAGVVDLPLAADYVSGRRRLAREDDEEPTRAVTRWRVVERFAGAALLEVQLETGRQHQIRLHLSAVGLPILGDAVYRAGHGPAPDAAVRGSRSARLPGAPRQMLHAQRLAFANPLSGSQVRVEAPLPVDFVAVLRSLRRAARPPIISG